MKKHWTLMIPGALLLCATPAAAIELRDAVQAALQTNPEIRQAIHNTEATRKERRQAEGLWLPRVSVEASAGIRELNSPTRRAIDEDNNTLYPLEASVTAEKSPSATAVSSGLMQRRSPAPFTGRNCGAPCRSAHAILTLNGHDGSARRNWARAQLAGPGATA